MTTSELALLDTNVLVNAVFENSEHFAAARDLLDRGRDAAAGFQLLPQNVTEFYAVVTNPKRVTTPKSPSEALSAIRTFLGLSGIALLPVPTDVVSRCKRLTGCARIW
jgi:predicted nucleic acid-binding protein